MQKVNHQQLLDLNRPLGDSYHMDSVLSISVRNYQSKGKLTKVLQSSHQYRALSKTITALTSSNVPIISKMVGLVVAIDHLMIGLLRQLFWYPRTDYLRNCLFCTGYIISGCVLLNLQEVNVDSIGGRYDSYTH